MKNHLEVHFPLALMVKEEVPNSKFKSNKPKEKKFLNEEFQP